MTSDAQTGSTNGAPNDIGRLVNVTVNVTVMQPQEPKKVGVARGLFDMAAKLLKGLWGGGGDATHH